MQDLDRGARSRYLLTAVATQKILDVLVEFIETGETQNLDSSLDAAVALLQVGSSKGSTLSSHEAVPLRRSFEFLRTVEDVVTKDQRDAMIRELEVLKARRASRQQMNDVADRALRFFARIEDRALLNASQNFEPPPRGLRELCGRT
jgi:hypothetical protein